MSTTQGFAQVVKACTGLPLNFIPSTSSRKKNWLKLKEQVVVESRQNNELQQGLSKFEQQISMNLKQNATVEEVAAAEKRMNQTQKQLAMSPLLVEAMQEYGKLFGLLQSEPSYLASMCDVIPLEHADTFVKFIIYTLFPNAYDQNEENKLLLIIQRILENTYAKCKDITAFMRENSAAPKLLTAYTRREPSMIVLQKAMTKPLSALLKQTKLSLDLNPRKILQAFLREGKADVKSIDSPEVLAAIKQRVGQTQDVCDSFLDSIFAADLSIGMRLVARTLRDLVRDRPIDSMSSVTNVDIADSLVGGFVFLRYINPAIIDYRMVLQDNVDANANARRNLIQTAKIVQNMSNGVVFGEKEKFMQAINPYLRAKLTDFHTYFAKITDIPTLEDFIKVESQLDQDGNDAIVFLSMKELNFFTNLCKTHLNTMAPAENDPLRKLMADIESKYSLATLVERQDMDKYLKILVGSQKTTSTADTDTKTASPAAARAQFVEALGQVVVASLQNADAVPAYIAAHPEQDAQSALTFLCETAAAAVVTDPVVQTLVTKSIAVVREFIAATQDVNSCFSEEIVTALHRSKMLFDKLNKDVDTMADAVKEARAKFAMLNNQATIFREYLHNIQDQTKYKLGWQGAASSTASTGEHEAKLVTLDDVMSSTGLIGGLASKVQADIAEIIKHHLHTATADTLFMKDYKKANLDDSEVTFFPRTCGFYPTAMQTMANIGRHCIEPLAVLLVQSLPVATRMALQLKSAEQQGNNNNDTFSWAAFLQLVPNLSMTNKDHSDMFDCVVDLLAGDMLAAVFQQIKYDTVLSDNLTQGIVKVAHALFQDSKPRKLHKTLWAALRSHIRKQWAVVIGQMSLCSTDVVLTDYEASLKGNYTSSSVPNRINIIAGHRYMQFSFHSKDAVARFARYVEMEIFFYNFHVAKARGSNLIAMQIEHFRNLTNAIAQADFSKESKTEEGRATEEQVGAITALNYLWIKKLTGLWTQVESVATGKSDDVRPAAINLMSTLIQHAPLEFYEAHIGDFVQSVLLKHFGASKKRLKTDMGSILHFLRGGLCQQQQIPGITHRRGIPVDRVAQLFGFGKYKLTQHYLAMIYELLIVKKAVAKMPDLRRIAERIVVQMAYHQFQYVTSTMVIPGLCKSKHTSEQLVGLRALEIIIDARSGFVDYCVSQEPCDGPARARVVTNTLALSSNIIPTVLRFIEEADKQVGLKTVKVNPEALSPAQADADRNELTRERYLEWIDKSMYDIRSEKQFVDGDPRSASVASIRGQKNFYMDLYYHALRLFPGVMPDKILMVTAKNCAIDGLFIGKLLCHPETIIAQTAFESMKRVMLNYPDERGQLMECFVLLLKNSAFQQPQSLITLFRHIVILIKLWINKLSFEHESKRLSGSRASVIEVNPEQLLNNAGERFPSRLRWISAMDGMSMLFLGHHNAKVRTVAIKLIETVQRIIHTWIRIKTGKDVKPSAKHAYSLNCVGDVLDVYQNRIMQAGLQLYKSSRFTERDNTSGHNNMESKLPALKTLVKQDNGIDDVRSACVSMAAYTFVETGRFHSMLNDMRTVVLAYLDSTKPLPMVDEGKKSTFTAQEIVKWTFYNMIFFSVNGDASFFGKAAANRTQLGYLRGKFSQFLSGGWWNSIVSEVSWVRNGVVMSAMSVHSSCMSNLVSNLIEHYNHLKEKEKKKSKLALVMVTQLFHKIARGYGFTDALEQDSKAVIFPIYKEFITATQAQLWDPKKLGKTKWADTQLDLVRVLTYFAAAVDRVAARYKALYFSEDGQIKNWTLAERFELFKWLIRFAQKPEEASSAVAADDPGNNDAKANTVRYHCSNALRHFCSLGIVIPPAEMNGQINNGLIPLTLQIDDEGHFLLSVLLCYHTHYLFPLYVDKVYTSDSVESKVFFRAIAEPFISGVRQLQGYSTQHKSIKDLIGAYRLQTVKTNYLKTIGKGKLAQLVFCALYELVDEDYQTRYNAFSMLVDVAAGLIGVEFSAYLKSSYRFAFEGKLDTWARITARKISTDIAKACPEISFQLFREACSCMKTKKNLWISELLLPWSEHLILSPLNKPESRRASTAVGGDSELQQQTLAAAAAAADSAEEGNTVELKISGKPESWYVKGNLHTTLRFLSQLFDLLTSGHATTEELLPIYSSLAKVEQNIKSILEFIVQRVTDHGSATVPLCKTILFTVYQRECSRKLLLSLITQYLLKVLKMNASELSSSNLKNRLKGYKILSVLESNDESLQSTNTQAHDFSEYENLGRDNAAGPQTEALLKKTRAAQDKMLRQSYVVAALLVELIGVSITPVMTVYPVIVVYAMMHLHSTKPFIKDTMHKLLSRLFSAFCDTSLNDLSQDTEEQDGEENGIQSISAALRSRDLHLQWQDAKGGHSSGMFLSGHDSVVMRAESFIGGYCAALDTYHPGSSRRIGYEALRWGVLSTSVSLVASAHGIYRTLLQPLNEACVYALMTSLLVAVEDWTRQRWYANNDTKTTPGSRGAATRNKREVCIIIDTLERVLHSLAEQGKLLTQPSLFWVSVALLRVDDADVYQKALRMLKFSLTEYTYLITTTSTAGNSQNSNSRNKASKGEVTHVDPDTAATATANSNTKTLENKAYTQPPDDFWTYQQRWAPGFDGIQSYLLKGFRSTDTDTEAVEIAQLLTRVSERLVDQSHAKYAVLMISVLPWLYHSVKHEKLHMSARRLLTTLGNTLPMLTVEFQEFLKQATLDSDAALLKIFCRELNKTYSLHMGAVSEVLIAMLKSDDCKEYHPFVYLVSAALLSQPDASLFVKDFQPLISQAHLAITASTKTKEARASVLRQIVDHKQADAAREDYHRSLSGPAAHLVGTVISVVNNTKTPTILSDSEIIKTHRRRQRGFSSTTMKLAPVSSVLPNHSIKSVVSALKQIIQCSPMFADSDE